MYFNHNSNIKCIGSIIKYIVFKSIYHTINLNIVSSFIVFSNFDFLFSLMYYSSELMKLIFSLKKKSMDRRLTPIQRARALQHFDFQGIII